MRKYKLTLFMLNGKKIVIRCNGYSIPKLTGDSEKTIIIKEPNIDFSFDINQVCAITVCRSWCSLFTIY